MIAPIILIVFSVRAFALRLEQAGKPFKVVLLRKLLISLSLLAKKRQNWFTSIR